MKRPEGVTLIAALHILNAILFGAAALLILFVPVPIIWFNVTEAVGRFWSLYGLGIGITVFVVLGGLALLLGAGLLRLQDWARWLTIVLALIALPAFPVGSVVGALTIAYLVQPSIGEAFHPSAHPVPIPRPPAQG
jgi:hypothetical protein